MSDVLLLIYFTTSLLLAFKDVIIMNYLSSANTKKVKTPLILLYHDPCKRQRDAGENSPLQLYVWGSTAEKVSTNDSPVTFDFLPDIFNSARSVEEKQPFQFSKPCLREPE